MHFSATGASCPVMADWVTSSRWPPRAARWCWRRPPSPPCGRPAGPPARPSALQVGLRPLLVPSRLEDPLIKVLWVDSHHSRLEGSRATVEIKDGILYLAVSLRNVESSEAVLHGWHPVAERVRGDEPHADSASLP